MGRLLVSQSGEYEYEYEYEVRVRVTDSCRFAIRCMLTGDPTCFSHRTRALE